jgi:magnesium transporter
MAQQQIDLALAFLQSQPGAAATILEQQPIEQVADFLSHVPHTYGATVLEKILPHYAARLCKILKPNIAAALLSEMNVSLVAAVMRHCPGELSSQLLDLLPEKTRLACWLLLTYSEDSVGAWMTANVSTLPDDCNVEEALARVTSEQGTVNFGATLVVDRDRHIKGQLQLPALIRALPNTAITAVMDKILDSLSARTALSAAANHPLWVDRDSIPVTNRNQQLVGLLRHVDLRRGLAQISTSIVKTDGADPITGIYETYGKSLLALFDTVTDLTSSTGRGN